MNEIVAPISQRTHQSQQQEEVIDDGSLMFIRPHVRSFRADNFLYDKIADNDVYSDDPDDILKEQKQRRGCGACSTFKKKNEEEGLENVSKKTGGDMRAVAQEAAENIVSFRLEFLKGITIHHTRYEKKSNERWENKGRDLTELFNEEEAGGDRKGRYETLKGRMDQARVGIVVSEPTVYEELNYIQVFIDGGDHVDMYAFEHRGNIDDLTRLYKNLAGKSRETDASQHPDFSRPLFFAEEISFSHLADTIEQSFATEESRSTSGDYLRRLKRDVANVSLIDEYQQEVEELMKKFEQELRTHRDLQQGLAAIVWGMEAFANGEAPTEQSVRFVRHHPVDVVDQIVGQAVDYIAEKVNKRLATDGKKETLEKPDEEKHQHQIIRRILEEKELFILTQEPQKKVGEKRTTSQIWRETAQKILHITAEEAEKLEHAVYTTWKKMTNVREQIALSVDTGIGIGGAVFALESIATMGFENESDVFEDRLEKAAMTIVTEKNTGAIVHVEPIEHLIDIVTKQSEEETSLYTDEAIVLAWLKDFIPTLDHQTPEQAVAKIDNEQERIAENVQLICDVIKENVLKETTNKEHAIRDFSIAVTLWMILKYVSYHQRLESVKKAIIAASANGVAASKSHLSEALVPQESTSSWLLFAIIWYLAMIREQGAINASGAKYQAKRSKKQVFSNQTGTTIPMQQYAVIYPSVS